MAVVENRNYKRSKRVIPQGDWSYPEVSEALDVLRDASVSGKGAEYGLLEEIDAESERISSSHDRGGFKFLVDHVLDFVSVNPESDFVIIPLFDLAVRQNWMRRFERQARKKLGWEGKVWVGHWYWAAVEASLATESLYFYHSKLWRWIERGRFDRDLWPLIPLWEKYHQNEKFVELVENRIEVIRETGGFVLGWDLT